MYFTIFQGEESVKNEEGNHYIYQGIKTRQPPYPIQDENGPKKSMHLKSSELNRSFPN